MKYILSIFILIFLALGSFSFVGSVSANSLFNNTTTQIPYCKDKAKCGLQEGINEVKKVDNLKTTGDAAGYVTSVVTYLIGFVYLIAVILIIYAGFYLLTGIGDEEKAKKSKIMILYVIMGIALIFLANPIIKFIMNMLG